MEKKYIFFGQKMHFFDKKMHFFDKEAFFSNKKYFVCRLTRLPFYKILFSLIWKKKIIKFTKGKSTAIKIYQPDLEILFLQ